MSPGHTLEPADSAAVPRVATLPAVPRLEAAAENLERVERWLRQARRHHMALALLCVAQGPLLMPDGAPAPAGAAPPEREFARRLRARIRATDDLWWCADAQWIGILLSCRPEGALAARRRLVVALAEPFRLDAGLVRTIPRIGVSSLTADTPDAGALLAVAQALQDAGEWPEPNRRAP